MRTLTKEQKVIHITQMSCKFLGSLNFAFTLFLLFFAGNQSVLSDFDTKSYDWSTAKELRTGILHAKIERTSPQKMVINCLRIDSHTPGMKLYTTPRCSNWLDDQSETIRQTTRDFIRQSQKTDQKLVVAINASPFSPWPAPYQKEEPTDISGFAVSQGIVVSNQKNVASLLASKAGSLQISMVSTELDISNVETAVSGFSLCLTNGEPSSSGTQLHPRTGIGLSKDGQYLFFLTIDGRQTNSYGATVCGVGNLLKIFGAYNGINMDGGGSTTMAWWDPSISSSDKCRLLNRPVGNGDDYRDAKSLPDFVPTERANGNNLGVYFVDVEKVNH